ncbi:unnamed protein product [Paramecium octaurelia]|uniref:Uncharacterized protein n=1 Tax=Paramecium octaurelia TaxID=43137 RepID=A0A8S1Y380_PAROT|nr:unnamed protein product [Paramecium octaurelia]
MFCFNDDFLKDTSVLNPQQLYIYNYNIPVHVKTDEFYQETYKIIQFIHKLISVTLSDFQLYSLTSAIRNWSLFHNPPLIFSQTTLALHYHYKTSSTHPSSILSTQHLQICQQHYALLNTPSLFPQNLCNTLFNKDLFCILTSKIQYFQSSNPNQTPLVNIALSDDISKSSEYTQIITPCHHNQRINTVGALIKRRTISATLNPGAKQLIFCISFHRY